MAMMSSCGTQIPPGPKMVGLGFPSVVEPSDVSPASRVDADPALRSWNPCAYIDGRDGA